MNDKLFLRINNNDNAIKRIIENGKSLLSLINDTISI